MIGRISIKNFRSHERTVLELHPGVNAIIGHGQAGKTNVKRAMEWVLNNRPLGTRFISWWANGDPTEVEVDVINPEGLYTVTMTKAADSSATYMVEGPYASAHRMPSDPDPVSPVKRQVFETVGTKVPDVVKRVLNLDAVNMQAQLEQPYLVTGSKGDISRAVNRVIQIEVADKWLSELNSRATRNTAHVKALEAVIEVQQVNVDRLADLPKAEEYLVAAEQEEVKMGVARRRAEGIAQLIADGIRAEQVVQRFEQLVTPLDKLLSMAEATQVTIEGSQNTLAWINSLWGIEADILRLMGQYQAVAQEYVALLEELGQCPTCLSPVDDNIINQLKEEL